MDSGFRRNDEQKQGGMKANRKMNISQSQRAARRTAVILAIMDDRLINPAMDGRFWCYVRTMFREFPLYFQLGVHGRTH